MAGVVVLDASALIALYSDRDPHHLWAVELFKQTAADTLELSVLSFAEVLVHPTRSGKRDQFLSGIQGLGLKIVDLPADAGADLAALRNSTGLKMPDVVVLQRAIQAGASLASSDQKLADTAREHGVPVRAPDFS